MNYCEFEHCNESEVSCKHCGRRLSGTPERYENAIICSALGPGADIEKVLKKLASFLKREIKTCQTCDNLKQLMNARGIEWCRENRKLLAALIQYNAKQQNIQVPLPVLTLALRYALRR